MDEFIEVEDINEDDYLDDMDLEIIDFIKNLDNIEEKPLPTPYRISTHTSNATVKNPNYPNCELMIDITFLIKHLIEKIINDNFLNPIENPIFQGIVINNNECSMNIRFDDDMYRKVRYYPNTVSIKKVINNENKYTKNKDYETTEYFDEHNIEETREKLKDFIQNCSFTFVQKNSKEKKDEKKKCDINDYDKQSVITTYNIYTGNIIENKETKETKEIEIIENEEELLKDKRKKKISDKEAEYMYNSCSIIIKPSKEIKAVNVRLFSDTAMTITGGLNQNDGYIAAKALLNEIINHGNIIKGIRKLDVNASTESARKKNKILFPLPSDDYISGLEVNHNITLINSNFSTKFRIDLEALYKLLVANEEDLFVVYYPNNHRGIQISYFWNKNNKSTIFCESNQNYIQDGICKCGKKCSAKKNRKKSYSVFDSKISENNETSCTKVKICVFKTGSISLIGGTDKEHTECAYHFINNLLDKYYKDIVTISIDDYLNEKKNKKDSEKINALIENLNIDLKSKGKEKKKKEKVVKEKIVKEKVIKGKKNNSKIIFKNNGSTLILKKNGSKIVLKK